MKYLFAGAAIKAGMLPPTTRRDGITSVHREREAKKDLARIRAVHRRLDALQFPSDKCIRARTHCGNGMGLGLSVLGVASSLRSTLQDNVTYVPAIDSLSVWANSTELCGREASILCFMDLTSCRVEHLLDASTVPPDVSATYRPAGGIVPTIACGVHTCHCHDMRTLRRSHS